MGAQTESHRSAFQGANGCVLMIFGRGPVYAGCGFAVLGPLLFNFGIVAWGPDLFDRGVAVFLPNLTRVEPSFWGTKTNST